MPEYGSLSDEKLVEKIRSQDKELYVYIVERYQYKLMKYVTYLIHDQPKATDVVQQTFIKAFINLKGFDTKKKFSSWLYRIAHNEAINIAKKYRKEVVIGKDFDIRSNQDLEEELSKKEIINKTQKCLGEMPIIYAEPLALYYLDDRSYEEISDILRIPMGTVATRLNRAKQLMKHICQKNK